MTIFVGCANSNRPKPVYFKNFDKQTSSSKNGIIYVYRTPQFLGSAVSYDVFLENNKNKNSKFLGHLFGGTYLKTEVPAGEYTIWAKTESKNSVSFNVNPLRFICIKGEVSVGFLVGTPSFTIVDQKTCKKEIYNSLLNN